MTTFQAQKKINYTAEQIFDLVIDIEKYPEFLPWCSAAKITDNPEDGVLIADLVVKFKAFQEKYTSKVVYARPTAKDPNGYIIIDMIEGPFLLLKSSWRFENNDDGSSNINFRIDFEFKSKLLEHMIGFIFTKAQQKVLGAFTKRADELY